MEFVLTTVIRKNIIAKRNYDSLCFLMIGNFCPTKAGNPEFPELGSSRALLTPRSSRAWLSDDGS